MAGGLEPGSRTVRFPRAGGRVTPPDRDFEAALRRELAAAASAVEPAAGALERIRARTGKHPPQPWLLSVLSGVVTRARYWVWSGHWVWPGSPSRPRALHRRDGRRPAGGVWLRPVAVLAGVAFLAAIGLAVGPVRQAIVQVSSNLTGGQQSGGSGTNGTGSHSGTGGGGTLANGAHPTTAGPSGVRATASPTPAATTPCGPAASAKQQASANSKIASVVSSATALVSPHPSASRSVAPSSSPSSAPSATVTANCPTPTASASHPAVVPSVISPSLLPTPTPTPTSGPTATATPTSSPNPAGSGTAGPTASPSDADSGSSGATVTSAASASGTPAYGASYHRSPRR